MSEVNLTGIHKSFDATPVLRNVDIDVRDGEFMVFVGPSGCGKTTLMRTIAGLERPDSGQVTIQGADVTQAHPARRGVAMVFQSYALYPHMTVRENIGFGLKVSGQPASSVREKVEEAARILQIEALLDRKPAMLSGGQRQRVAIGRSIVRDPHVFLFDEPLSNLDAALRVQMRLELIKLHRRLGATMVYVTHDQVEAMTMADRIVVLNQGYVEQIGTPMDLYERPTNQFVAGFIGSPKMNFLDVTVEEAESDFVRVQLPGNTASMSLPVNGDRIWPGANLTMGIRPEHLERSDGDDQGVVVEGRTTIVEHLGGEILAHVAITDGVEIQIKMAGHEAIAVDERIALRLPESSCHLFDEQGESVSRSSGSALSAAAC